MSLKLCFNNEIHRVSKLPVSISALNQTVTSTFPNLTTAFSLLYDDSEGDRVTLKTDDDLKTLYTEQQSSGKSIKIIVSTSSSVDRRKDSLASEKSFEVVYNVRPQVQPPQEEQKVSDITGDKTFVIIRDDPAPEETNWMKHLPPRVRVFKMTKKLLSGKVEGPKKEKVQKELDDLKAKLTPEDLKWLEEKMACLDENGVCKRKFHKGSHSRSKDKLLPPKKEAKHISKRLFFMKSVSPDEKKTLEARLVELEALLTPEEKEEIASKQAKWAAKAEKRKEKKKKLVNDFSAFIKENIEGMIEISGHQAHKHFKPHGPMKKLVKELLETYKALPEEKKAVVTELLNGIPEKLVKLADAKDEKKAAWKGFSKEEKCEWKAKKIEERNRRFQEHAVKKAEREKAREEKQKEKSKERKSKSPEKKTPNPPIVKAARKFSPSSEKKISIIKEIFPDMDVEQAKSFIDANPKMSVDELIQSMLTSTIKK